MRGKIGSGHFEMIISFVFFVGFVFFIFIFLGPQNSSSLSGSVIAGLHSSFEEAVYTNLTTMFLSANYTGACFNVDLPEEIFVFPLVDDGIHVTDVSGSDINSGLNGDDLSVGSDEDYFRVFISPEFSESSVSGCPVLVDYRLGGLAERNVISYSALLKMKANYTSDYEGLKDDLRIPGVFDFSIISRDFPAINMQKQVPNGVDVIVEEHIFEVLNSSGSLINGRFVLKVW